MDKILEVFIDALTKATLRGNPILPPDPRGLILYRIFSKGSEEDLVVTIFDEASQITFMNSPLVSLADAAAREAGIAPRWGSGRRHARDGGGFPGWYLGWVRFYIHTFHNTPEIRDKGLRLVAEFWTARVLDCARAHGYVQDPETHLWVPPPKPQQ